MESIGSLAGGIAHDFNNILFPIVGLSEMMMEDFPEDSSEYQNLKEILTAGKRGSDLVNQILTFSRQSEDTRMPIQFQSVLKEVLKLCRSTIPTDITVHQNIQGDCGFIMANPTQLHQIAMNLITNAYHAVESTGGNITVKLQEVVFSHGDAPDGRLSSGRYAVLSVCDTGTGIDPAVMNKIFDPYFTTKEKGRGTGLGLATVYGIVKAHGGDIRVHSELKKGSSFHIYLPVLEKPSADGAPEKQQQSLPTGAEHILLVDDEKPVLQLEKQILERLGYSITSFSSSVDALAAFRTDPSCFDLIISDMNMPNLNGMQLAEKLIEIRSDIPVIICTGFSERINREISDAIGIKGFLMKPVAKHEMAEMVRKVLDSAK
ncbi:MAG: response regulator [Desulfobacteraceae bacterium]